MNGLQIRNVLKHRGGVMLVVVALVLAALSALPNRAFAAGTSGPGWHMDGSTLIIDGSLSDDYMFNPDWSNLDNTATAAVIKPGASVPKLEGLFAGKRNLKTIQGFENLKVRDSSGSARSVFYRCESLTSVDLSGLKYPLVDVSGMFVFCRSLTSVNLSGLSTSGLKDMSGMFISCSSLRSVDLGSWDISKVVDMAQVFLGCSSLQSVNLKGWDTSKVTDMSAMFSGCKSLKAADVSSFDTANVRNFACMFEDCSSLESLDLSNFSSSSADEGSVRQVHDIDAPAPYGKMGDMFKGLTSLRSLVLGEKFKLVSGDQFKSDGLDAKWFRGPAIDYATLRAIELRPTYPQATGAVVAKPEVLKAVQAKAASAQLYVGGNYVSVAVAGEPASSVRVLTYGAKVAKPADPERDGYKFGGWFLDEGLTKPVDFNAKVTGDLVLHPKWEKIAAPQPKAYTVTFDANGGSAVAAQKVAEGKAVAKPADPTRSGYTFKGWFSDKALTKAYDFKAAVKSDLTLYAKWAKAAVPAPKPESRPSDQFTDVTGASTWVINQGYLDYAVEKGLMTGYRDPATGKPNGKFGPEDTLTRGQVAVVLYRVATGKDSGDGSTGFKDQGAFPYYRTAIKWLKDNGISTGDRDPVTQAPLNTFRPDAPITRQELATLVYRFAKQQGVKVDRVDTGSLGAFKDGAAVLPFAREAVAWCNATGIITGGQGADAGQVMPGNNATRAQAAKIFSVLHKDVLKK